MRVYSTLWRTYGFIVVTSVVTAFAMSYISWLAINNQARIELKYANNIVTRSMQQVLHKNEALLEILGERLIELGPALQSSKGQQLIDDLLNKNPDLAGIGLADTSGQLILTSFNIDRNNLPNLLTTPETAATFKQAMQNDNMVIGRTYFMKALDTWVIPLRYRITDNRGKVVAVMTTGIKLDSSYSLWSRKALPEHVQLSVVRSDLYHQYSLHIDVTNIDRWYNEALSHNQINQFYQSMQKQTGLNAEDLRTGNEIILVKHLNDLSEDSLSAISYDPVYQHYTYTSTPMKILYGRMLIPAVWLTVLLLIFNLALYFIFSLNMRLQLDSKSKLEFQANHDELTELPNRRYLLGAFENWQRSQGGVFSVLFIDLDDFKLSNDLHGHSIGDRLLREVVKRIKSTFPDCMKIRQGGDEFIIMCPETDEKVLVERCKQFSSALQQPVFIDELEFSVRASIGIARAPVDGNGIDELLRKADMAMYRAKKLKCGAYLYSKDLEQLAQRVANIEKALVHALQNNEFSLVYQPQIDSGTRSVIGAEALLRWHNSDLGQVPPDEFIRIAESTGLIKDIGKYVFETAVREMVEIYQHLYRNDTTQSIQKNKIRLSINVSVQQLNTDDFVNFIQRVLGQYNSSGIPVMVEVTESIFINEPEKIRILLEKIKQAGVEISLDDFGTGYSSLNVLNKLPISELKIDKGFVKDILSNKQDWLLIQSIISMSKNLGIPVLAEGVENNEQAKMLAENGCNLFQGYYFSKPLDKDALIAFISEAENSANAT